MAKDNEVLLGQKVKCLITNFEGTCTSITQYLHGCRRIGIQPVIGEDGKLPDSIDIDEPQLNITDAKRIIKVEPGPALLELGQEAIDPVTGYTGIVIGRCVFINGCSRIGLQEKYDPKTEKEFDTGKWFHEPQLKAIKKKIDKEVKPPKATKRTGGPGMMASYKNSKGKM